ncbi:MAG: DUF1349 domain-containing protein [Lachnospiraceae bacterium]|nr:DUF1349 domain-containing protein [Lachnospiraceae bacterium]
MYYTELTGDFVFKTKVALEFKNFYDAAALLVYENENVWAKAATVTIAKSLSRINVWKTSAQDTNTAYMRTKTKGNLSHT